MQGAIKEYFFDECSSSGGSFNGSKSVVKCCSETSNLCKRQKGRRKRHGNISKSLTRISKLKIEDLLIKKRVLEQ